MKSMLIIFSFAVLSTIQHAYAGVTSGKVVSTYVLACPTPTTQSACAIGIIALNVTNTGVPTCGATAPAEWAFALDTIAGKAMFNAILHAQAVGATVSIIGDGTCGAWFDRERPSYLRFTYP